MKFYAAFFNESPGFIELLIKYVLSGNITLIEVTCLLFPEFIELHF